MEIPAAVAAAKGGAAVARFGWRRLQLLGVYEPEWLDLAAKSGLTATEVADVGLFLQSSRMRPLLSIIVVTVVSTPHGRERVDAIATLKSAFENEAQHWCAKGSVKWRDHAPAIWLRLIEILEDVLPTGEAAAGLAEEAAAFSRFINSALDHDPSARSRSSQFVRRLTRLGF